MCGIAGFAWREGPGIDWQAVLDSISHRGPDSRGHREIGLGGVRIGFGHTRLSILDLSPAGAQPMESRDGRWLVSFNGELYSHMELRSDLEGPFRGSSDTETLAEALSAWGVRETLGRLNGMFAFAALDMRERRVYLARDPFGIKPLYYCTGAEGLRFSSELRGLFAMGLRPEVCMDGLDTFLALRYVPSPKTMLKGVDRLSPGHLLSLPLETGEASTEPYTRPQTGRFASSLEVASEVYRERLQAAVQRQLLSDVPVGILLSGGIDSALVAAMAAEAGRPLTGFTVGFGEGAEECELGDAAHTAAVLGMEHRTVTVGPEGLWADLPAIAAAVEEPLGTTSVMPMWSLAKLAREEATVVLTGQGSDEPWGGYRRYQMELLRSRAPSRLWSLLRPGVSLPGVERLPDFVARGLRSLPEAGRVWRFRKAAELFTETERRSLTGRSGCGGADAAFVRWLDWLGPEGLPPAEQMMRIDARMQLSDDLLLYGDKISMAVALEARVPMLDLELMDFVESLPLALKAGLRRTKIVHKHMAEGYLPREIVHRKKKGFQVPFGDWSRGCWKDRLEEVLLSPGSPHLDLVSRDALQGLWNSHQRGRPDRSRQIFSLAMLSFWSRWLESI
jgi:asparagine synthase (glutamine-hydrolysing)